jgi:hypothetical protein
MHRAMGLDTTPHVDPVFGLPLPSLLRHLRSDSALQVDFVDDTVRNLTSQEGPLLPSSSWDTPPGKDIESDTVRQEGRRTHTSGHQFAMLNFGVPDSHFAELATPTWNSLEVEVP